MINNDVTFYKRFENFTNEASKICISLTNRISRIFRNTISTLYLMACSIVINTKNYILMVPLDISIRVAFSIQAQAIAINMLALGPIFQYTRSVFLEEASRNGNLETVKALLANGPISEVHRTNSVYEAARRGHFEIVLALLTNGPVGFLTRGFCFNEASKKGHLETVNFILANFAINNSNRGSAVIEAARNGHLEVVIALLARGPISENHQASSVFFATANGHIEIVHILQQAQVVPNPIILNPQVDNTLNVHTGNRDQKVKASIINFYTHQGPISKHEIDSAFTSLLLKIDSEKEPLKTKALDALIVEKRLGEAFGPFVDKDATFTVLGHEVHPKEFIARLWIFANRLSNEADRPLAIQSIIGALADSFKENGQRVCNQGKLQRLIVGVLQGRLASVNIEDHEIGIQIIDSDRADQLFFAKESRQQIKSLKALLIEASDFCKQNALINKKEYLEHLAADDFLEMQEIFNDVGGDLKEFIEGL